MNLDGPTVFACVFGLILVVVALAFGFGIGSSKQKTRRGQPTVLIVGPSNAGKTCLFYKWQNPETKIQTVTSVSPNEDTDFRLAPSHRIIDCPGNEKLSPITLKLIAETNLKAVVFVIDAADGLETIKESARLLISVLEISESSLIPVLIAANKFDLFSAVSVPKIKALLEQEISGLRDTRQQTVPSSENDGNWDGNEKEFLGVDGKKFEFDDLESEVDVRDGSVRTGRTQKWDSWLEQVLL